MFLKSKLGRCIVLSSSDLVIKIEEGRSTDNNFGFVVVGTSFKDVAENKIARKLRALDKSEKEIVGEVKLQRLNILKAYKSEIVSKLESLGIDQEAVEAVEKELKGDDLEYLLH